MMTRYALLYERLGETVVSYYAEGTVTTERCEVVAAPRQDVEQTMNTQGWKYRNTPGPQSILMQHA